MLTDAQDRIREQVLRASGLLEHVGSFVGGELLIGEPSFEVSDPATGHGLATVAAASAETCRSALDAAADAGPGWAATSPRERAEVLRRAHDLLLEEQEALAALITLENGKVLAEARAEVRYAADYLDWFAGEAVRISGSLRESPSGDKHIVVLPRPVGVALLITPWNFPAAMAARKVAPALAAGCTAVLKPAAETPLTAFAMALLLRRAGLPPGALNVVVPDPPGPAVAEMLQHPALRKLSFTGSTAVGGLLLEQAAPRALRCSMELGGNAPFIVTAQAAVDVAVDSAMVAKLRNGGASCVAANRFYVHEAVAEEFVASFAERLAAQRVGPGMDPETDIGPLISAAECDKVARVVERATSDGARAVAAEAPDGAGSWFPPTLLDGLDSGSPILQTEIFGPVAPVVRYSDDDDVAALANSTASGLAAYVMSGDSGAALSLARRLETGMVGINRGAISDAAAPFGGLKSSGLGKEGGHEGIEEYLERTYVAMDL